MKKYKNQIIDFSKLLLQKSYLIPSDVDSTIFKNFEEKIIKTKSYQLNYAETGKEHTQTLLLIHGMSNNWTGWIPLASILQKKYHLLMLDLPGYGKSQRLSNYSIEIEARAIAEFISELKVRPDAIIGLSMGSIVIGHFLSVYKKLVKKAILCGPMFRLRDGKWIRKASNLGLKAVDYTKGGSFVLKKVLTNTAASYLITKYINMHKFDRELVDHFGLDGRRLMDPKAFTQMGISVTNNSLADELDGVSIPVKLIYGDSDKLSSIEDAKNLLKDKSGHFEFVTIKDAGHIVTLEKPLEVYQEIQSFLE